MKTKIEIIKETVEYYSADVSRRSISYSGKCMYNGPEGKQCAFARCAEAIDEEYEEWNANEVLENKGIETLKPEYRHIIDVYFWNELQYLHDNCSNWDENGLTEDGKVFVKGLIHKYKN